MKILIVDNEKHVVDAIKMLIKWDDYPIHQVLTAFDGMEAVKVIEEQHPEIILTDMKMPNMDGMALLEWIAENAKYARKIVISGYSDFSYIQHTLRHGGLDYITKPIDEEELNKAILKAVNLVQSDQNSYIKEIEYRRNNLVYWEKIFSNVIDAPLHYQTELKQIKIVFEIEDETLIQIATIELLQLPENLLKQFRTDMNLFYFAIKNVCQEVISMTNSTGFVYLKGSNGRVQIIFWKDLFNTVSTMRQIVDCLRKIYGNIFQIGISEKHLFPDELRLAQDEATLAITQRNILDINEKIHLFKKMESDTESYFQGIGDEILLSIRGCNLELINDLLDKAFEPLNKKNYIPEKTLQHILQEYNLIKSYWLKDLFKNCESEVEYVELSTPLTVQTNYPSLFKIRQAISEDIQSIIKYQHTYEQSKNNAMYLIKKYIDSHYMEEVSLSMLSDVFYLSKEHLSRSFKKTFNMTISEYMSEMRMEKAKVLLGNNQLILKEIASRVGYEDEKYFSKVFRQKYAMTPNEYRNKMKN